MKVKYIAHSFVMEFATSLCRCGGQVSINTWMLDTYCADLYLSVLKLLKMAVGMRALLDTVLQALPQVNIVEKHQPLNCEASSLVYIES